MKKKQMRQDGRKRAIRIVGGDAWIAWTSQVADLKGIRIADLVDLLLRDCWDEMYRGRGLDTPDVPNRLNGTFNVPPEEPQNPFLKDMPRERRPIRGT